MGYFNFRVDVNKHFTINKVLLLQNICRFVNHIGHYY